MYGIVSYEFWVDISNADHSWPTRQALRGFWIIFILRIIRILISFACLAQDGKIVYLLKFWDNLLKIDHSCLQDQPLQDLRLNLYLFIN